MHSYVARSLVTFGSSIALVLTACATIPTDKFTTEDAGAEGGAASDGGSADSQVSQMDSATADTSTPDATPIAPFVVDSFFVASGFMGDGETAGTIAMIPAKPTDNSDCQGNRATPGAVGVCHDVTYTPPASAGKGWGGVFWQYPANNWGTKAGYSIPPGASKVSFWAKGAAGGEQVTFLAGGIAGAGSMYQDTVKSQIKATLTSAWAQYSIDISGQMYTQVLGGFGWTMTATSVTTSGHFYVDGIEWQ